MEYRIQIIPWNTSNTGYIKYMKYMDTNYNFYFDKCMNNKWNGREQKYICGDYHVDELDD